jgi:hypothetical protein
MAIQGTVLKIRILAITLTDSLKYISFCTIPSVFLICKKKMLLVSPPYDAPAPLNTQCKIQ